MSNPPNGAMIRVWNPGSDTQGPPDEVKAFGDLKPTKADLTEGVRPDAVIVTEVPADAAD